MTWHHLNMYCQSSNTSAKSRGADSQIINALIKLPLYLFHTFIHSVGFAHRPQKSFFSHNTGLLQ